MKKTLGLLALAAFSTGNIAAADTPGDYPVPVLKEYVTIVKADVNNDGRYEMFRATAASVQTLEGNLGRTLWEEEKPAVKYDERQKQAIAPFGSVVTMEPVDIDQDGDTDLIYASVTKVLWLKNEKGVIKYGQVFGYLKKMGMNSIPKLTFEDVDCDHSLDVIVTDQDGNKEVLYGWF